MRIQPARRIKGQIGLPGDKSISHRAAIVAALAEGNSTITNFASGVDCAATVSCLEALGVQTFQNGDDLRVEGMGRLGLRTPIEALDCGNSGSTMRMLAGVLAGQSFPSTLTGDGSLSARPMKRIIEPLEMMGAKVRSQDERPPLTIFGTRSLKPIKYELPVASAQVKSCVLLAALNVDGRTEVTERFGASRDHTERMLQWFGVPISITMDGAISTITISGPARLTARDVSIPGDISSAAYFIAAAGLIPDSDLTIEEVGLNPTRTRFLSVFRSLGASLHVRERGEESNEPVGSVQVSGKLPSRSDSADVFRQPFRRDSIAQLIDELPLLAVVGTQIPGGIEIRDAQELRFKESDRIAATVKNLRAMGAPVEEFEDGLAVGRAALRGATIESFGDHRIAMAFSVAALLAEGDSEIQDTECVGVSFPDFFRLLEAIVER